MRGARLLPISAAVAWVATATAASAILLHLWQEPLSLATMLTVVAALLTSVTVASRRERLVPAQPEQVLVGRRGGVAYYDVPEPVYWRIYADAVQDVNDRCTAGAVGREI